MLIEGIVISNWAAPQPWPMRAGCDGYPFDFDSSLRYSRPATGTYLPSQWHYNTSAGDGWLDGIEPFMGLIPWQDYAREYSQGKRPAGPWPVLGWRAGGVPFETAFQPFGIPTPKSG